MNWEKIKENLQAKNLTVLSETLGVGYLSLQKAVKGQRVLSEENRRKILKVLASNFNSAEAAISWLEEEVEFFDVPPLQEKEEKNFVRARFTYEEILSRLEPPAYYVSRPADEDVVSRVLSAQSKYRGIVITGIGGSGKTTLAKVTVRSEVLYGDFLARYDDILWVSCEKLDFSEIVAALANECGVAFQENSKHLQFFIRKKLQSKAVLLVLDSLDELENIRPLLALLGNDKSKLVISSRKVPNRSTTIRITPQRQLEMPTHGARQRLHSP